MFQPQAVVKWIRRSELLNVFKGLFSKYGTSKHHKVSGMHWKCHTVGTQLGRGTLKNHKAGKKFCTHY